MKGARTDRISMPLGVGLLLLATTGGLLWAQTAADPPHGVSTGAAAAAAPQAVPASDDAGESTPATDIRERILNSLLKSKHNFRKSDASARDVCATCHTPHIGRVPSDLAPGAGQPQPLRPYQDLEIELDSATLLCLGCHDGTTAPDVYSTSHATTLAGQLANSRLGVRGLRSHPVGVPYPPHDAQKYNPRAAVEAAGLTLPDGRIQCTTCHDPHNVGGHAGMLKTSNHRSRLCLTCHRL